MQIFIGEIKNNFKFVEIFTRVRREMRNYFVQINSYKERVFSLKIFRINIRRYNLINAQHKIHLQLGTVWKLITHPRKVSDLCYKETFLRVV